MNHTEAEIKAVAKAVGASLKRSGHPVPHSALLDSLAAALNKRNWNVLKSVLQDAPQAAPVAVAAEDPAPTYSDRTWFFLRLAYALGRAVQTVNADDKLALASAVTAVGPTLDGVLRWGGWNLPATLTLQTALVDAGDFKPDTLPTVGRMTFSFKQGLSVDIEVACGKNGQWYVTTTGSSTFYAELERAVSQSEVLPQRQSQALTTASQHAAPAVKAKFWTDDRVYEVKFDARPYLENAPDKALAAIFEVGFVGDQSTDWVAEYVSDKGLNAELSEAFQYLEAVNKAHRKDGIGFEVEVDRDDYLRWMDVHRRTVLAKLLCEHEGVSLVQAEEEEIRGMWDWLHDGQACEHSFETEDEAAVDAYEQLGLLQQALDGML